MLVVVPRGRSPNRPCQHKWLRLPLPIVLLLRLSISNSNSNSSHSPTNSQPVSHRNDNCARHDQSSAKVREASAIFDLTRSVPIILHHYDALCALTEGGNKKLKCQWKLIFTFPEDPLGHPSNDKTIQLLLSSSPPPLWIISTTILSSIDWME